MANNTLYNGSSQGFDYVCDGYVEYAKEIISGRSVPDLRDGLKPVARRIIHGSSKIKDKDFLKSLTVKGEIAKLHPHGDSSIYKAMAQMTDSNGSMNVPVFIGQGEFSHVYSSDEPAADRYTELKLNECADDYLRDMVACKMIPAEVGKGVEPEVLPVRYPAVLVNGTSGMAVSVSTSIPSFNFLDVIELTQEYLKTGKMETVICPDFPTGGILVRDDTELHKIMHTGKGRLKIRANVEIEGKTILVKEVPYGKTVEQILKAIDSMEIQGLQSAHDSTGSKNSSLIKINCKSLKAVDSVLMQLYKLRLLQTSFSSNMVFVESKEPVMTGVYGVIEKWVAWRREVAKLKFEKELDFIRPELDQLTYFMRLVQNEDWKSNILNKLAYESKKAGKDYLKEIFEDIPESVCDWIINRSVPSYNRGDAHANRYEALLGAKEQYEGYLRDIDSWIYEDLEDLKKTRSIFMARKTKETYTDYRFSKISDNEMEDDSFCVFTLFEDGFLCKTREKVVDSDKKVVASISAQANSTLIGFDCFGRILRVFGNDIPFTGKNDLGEYLPRYFEGDGFEGYKIMYLGLLDGKKRMLVYRDGFVGFLDTSEWVGKKKIRVVQRGVDTSVYNLLTEVIEEDDFSEYLVVAEDTGKKVRFGVAEVGSIREASRKSRAKVFGGSDLDIRYVTMMNYLELSQFMEEPFHFLDRLKPLGNREVYGDAGRIMKEGRYYELKE